MGIRKLADELDLSIGTVSRALNDRPDVSAETRARVKAAAEAMNYVPDQSGRSLRLGATGMVAAILPSVGFSSINKHVLLFNMMEGFRRTLIRAGIEPVILLRGPEESSLEHMRRTVSRRMVDGVMFAETEPDDPRIPYLRENSVRFVAFGRSAGHQGFDWVDCDFVVAAREAAGLLFDAGHARTALVTTDLGHNYFGLIEQGMREAAADRGLGTDAVSVHRLSVDADPRQAAAIFAGPGAPTGLLVLNEALAACVHHAAAAANRPVGGHTAMISVMPSRGDRDLGYALSCFDVDADLLGVSLAQRFLLPCALTNPGVKRLAKLLPMTFRPGTSHIMRVPPG